MSDKIKVQIKDLEKLYPSSNSPSMSHCRWLLKDGVDPNTCLECYRGEMLCLTILNIEEGAKLTVREEPSPHFTKVSTSFPQKG